jgi:hypothetical protein
MNVSIEKIEAMIYQIRGQRVMLDSDLAKLYGVETKVLNQAVKRNLERFPQDFMIVPDSSELASLRSQFVTLGPVTNQNYVFRYAPYLFTENGVAMLSSVLNSKEAIQINITIMRAFTKLRSFLSMDNSLQQQVNTLEDNTNKLFRIVFEKLDYIEKEVTPKLPGNRKKIGLNSNKKD